MVTPIYIGLWLIFNKILDIINQVEDLQLPPLDLADLNTFIPRETLREEVVAKWYIPFFEKAVADSLQYVTEGRKSVFLPGTFSSKDALRIFKHYLDPKEKVDFLLDIYPYLLYPLLKTYLSNSGILGGSEVELMDLFLQVLDYVMQFLALK
jgi:hypothetical protein